MKNIFLLMFLSQFLFGCSTTTKSQETTQVSASSMEPQPATSLHGQATGKPIIVYYSVPDWTACATPSISYEHNLKHKADMKPLKEVEMPKWGVPFEFDAFYYYLSMNDGYEEYYIVTSAYPISKIPESKCFDLVFENLDDEKMCEPEKITRNLKKWLLPNRVTLKDPQKIIKAAHQLPMTLRGCFEGKNLDISLSLKEVTLK